MKHVNHPKLVYKSWTDCFNEHFIRAMQTGFIDPEIGSRSVEKGLQYHEQGHGMVFIRDFYDELKEHKAHPTGTLADVTLRILNRLDRKYN